MPKISVVIPVYNRLFELERAIKSVLKQTIQDFEIIVVDDFSEEHVIDVINNINDKRIKYLRLPTKGNGNVCRNLGIKEAKGEFIAMLDSDDEWTAEHLQKKLNSLQEKNADGVFGSIMVDNGTERKDMISRPFIKGEKMVNYLLSDVHAQTSSYLLKSTCAKDILWDESLLRHQDWDYVVRFAAKYKFVPTYDLTCIVYWKKGERRAEHFDSLIKFIDRNKEDITPVLYSKYHRAFYTYILSKPDVDAKFKAHYKSESLKYVDVISLRDFIGTFGTGKSALYRLYLRFEFVLRVLFK